ncbi:hypothetical protein BDF19DRAFT_494079 [Syncephalis fuscata]|nr:hypothetical protein BDF19DRAFT_494079 [Syncephalis fuscata]
MFEANSSPHPFYSAIKKFSPIIGYVCYMVVKPKCGNELSFISPWSVAHVEIPKSSFLILINLIHKMQKKEWSMSEAISTCVCVTNNHIVFPTVANVHEFKHILSPTIHKSRNDQINQENDKLWANLAWFYSKVELGLTRDQALEYVRRKYKYLALPTINPPSYYPRRYKDRYNDPLIASTPAIDHQASFPVNINGELLPPPPYTHDDNIAAT